MSAPRRPSLADLPHRIRERMASLPDDWREWRAGLRQDPAVLWHSPLVRTCGLAVVGVVAIIVVHWCVSGFAPAGGGLSHEPTDLATLYVACTDPQCRAEYVTRQPMDFKDWPLRCDRCDQATVYRASLCKACGHWFAGPPGEPRRCPFCAEKDAAQAVEHTPRPAGTTSDDDEDPW